MRVTIDPVTRIEGHLSIHLGIDRGILREARCSGVMFRGVEMILKGRDPRDAHVLTQRICGVCPQSHAIAAVDALEDLAKVARDVPQNALLARNLIQGLYEVADHMLHFYQLAALDYVDVAACADYDGQDAVLRSVKEFISRGELGPFAGNGRVDCRLPKSLSREAINHYVRAIEVRKKAHEAAALLGGKVPHNVGVVPGGVTCEPTINSNLRVYWQALEIREFVDNMYLPDVLAVAEAYRDYFENGIGCQEGLSFGAYHLNAETRMLKAGLTRDGLEHEPLDLDGIAEEVASSWYSQGSGGIPAAAATMPQPGAENGYSWIKSPRYHGRVCEVGPAATILVSYSAGEPRVRRLVDGALSKFKLRPKSLFSTMGRHLARALRAKLIADSLPEWALGLKVGESWRVPFEVPENGLGVGTVDAPRGALSHWLSVEGGKIANYQVISPTTWNASPRDAAEVPGPMEQALEGLRVKDGENPIEALRVIRSFDPCLGCAVHLVDLRRR